MRKNMAGALTMAEKKFKELQKQRFNKHEDGHMLRMQEAHRLMLGEFQRKNEEVLKLMSKEIQLDVSEKKFNQKQWLHENFWQNRKR